jgi:cell shape-determining protein MreD
MVFIFRMASILSAVTGILPCPAAGLLLDVVEHDPFGMMLLRMIVSE